MKLTVALDLHVMAPHKLQPAAYGDWRRLWPIAWVTHVIDDILHRHLIPRLGPLR